MAGLVPIGIRITARVEDGFLSTVMAGPCAGHLYQQSAAIDGRHRGRP
jgi:hypothetical protein